jgi:hypothetical protein
MKVPKKEDYGFHTQNRFDDEPSGWSLEGGEDAYYKALEKYEKQFDLAIKQAEKYYKSKYPNVKNLSHIDVEIITLLEGYEKLIKSETLQNQVLISKEEYEILKRDSESLKQVNYLD